VGGRKAESCLLTSTSARDGPFSAFSPLSAREGASAWVLAELLRYAQKGGDLAQTAALVAGLMQRRYPFMEEVDGRVYFHVPKISARGVALLTLWHRYPGRVARGELVAAVKRHRFTENNAQVAVTRLAGAVVDDGQGLLKLLIPGLREAERLIDKAEQRDR
jgi:hypothetical protein